jgi:hypothetical protein
MLLFALLNPGGHFSLAPLKDKGINAPRILP